MPDRPKLNALTGIRFFAAFHVLVFHCWPWREYRGPGADVVGAGFIGVSLFFILSGYIFGYNYFGKEIEPRRFFRDRFARIYPVYAAALIVAFPLFLKLHGFLNLPVYTLTRFTLTQAWFPSIVLDWNTPAWSLAVETFFYLLFPLIAIPIQKISRTTAAAILIACCILAAVPGLLYLRQFGAANADTEGVWVNFLKFWPVVYLPEFVGGLCIMRLSAQLRARSANALAALALVFVVLAVAGPFKLPYPVLHTGGLLVPFGLLIFALSSNTGVVASFLSLPLVVLLGEASYSLYILHQPLHEYWMHIAIRLQMPRIATEAIFAVLMCATSILVYRKFEYPMRLKLKGQRRELPAELP